MFKGLRVVDVMSYSNVSNKTDAYVKLMKLYTNIHYFDVSVGQYEIDSKYYQPSMNTLAINKYKAYVCKKKKHSFFKSHLASVSRSL